MRKRSRARVVALQFLFQYDSGSLGPREEYAPELAKQADEPDVARFALELVDGCIEKWEPISRQVETASRNWSLDRMGSSDRNVLRLAAYELLYRDDIPPRATLNEAIELAKRFGSAESGAFVNGLLDRIMNPPTPEEDS